mgnify:CR=1 FL=1
MSKIGLVLEGGSMRGMFTAGVLDTFIDENIDVDGIIGVSAGALFGPNYYSKQKGRALRYNQRFCKDRRNMSLLSFLLTYIASIQGMFLFINSSLILISFIG